MSCNGGHTSSPSRFYEHRCHCLSRLYLRVLDCRHLSLLRRIFVHVLDHRPLLHLSRGSL
ncbi:hypothetical protein MBAV_002563 [Candidatus Magnetobacterium bavaricum]|uniref:Uncharacterized protein n=1 Tax=Candidatus Magnetobacterium bavaricum TaxID=29290 RepID=A0A0F3GX30_9BACT|nr:hypothetical protein MBAV_002563 [Candidatus Magnetobacterium bavaricum]